MRTRAERCRWIRQGWSGKSPSRSQSRQNSSVESSRSSASGALRGPPRSLVAPGDGAEAALVFAQVQAAAYGAILDRQLHVAGQPQLGAVLGAGDRLAQLAAAPARRLEPVAEARQALHLHLDLAVDAGHRPQQRAVGLVLGVGAAALAVGGHPLGDRQRVVDDDPAGVGDPGRLDHQRPRLVAAADRDDHALRLDREMAGAAVEQGGEGAGRVEAGEAEPLDGAVVGDQGGGVAVGEEAVAADGRKAIFAGSHEVAQASSARGGRESGSASLR